LSCGEEEDDMARLLASVAIVVAAAAVLLVGTAAAEPSKNPNTFPLPLSCANGISGTIYPTGAAGHLAGSNTVGVLHGEVTPTGGFFTPGFDASELTACTSPAAPGVTFYILILPRRG
jgi:hypothetical protein